MIKSSKANDALLDGAMEQFARHGFAKTSMSDIAKAAAVSRTSLYNLFSTKEEVFKALSSRINGDVHNAVMDAISARGDWDRHLLDVINARVSWVYELLHMSEYGRELINEKNRICGGDVLAANDRFQMLIASLLKESAGGQIDCDALAKVLIQSVNGVLEKAETRLEAEQSVGLLIEMFCKALGTTSR